MKRFIAAVSFLASVLVLVVAVPQASASGHTTPLKARYSYYGGNGCAPGACDNDRNAEVSRLRALGWCISSNQYNGLAYDAPNLTEITWRFTTCKDYVIIIWDDLRWTSASGFFDITVGEVFP